MRSGKLFLSRLLLYLAPLKLRTDTDWFLVYAPPPPITTTQTPRTATIDIGNATVEEAAADNMETPLDTTSVTGMYSSQAVC